MQPHAGSGPTAAGRPGSCSDYVGWVVRRPAESRRGEYDTARGKWDCSGARFVAADATRDPPSGGIIEPGEAGDPFRQRLEDAVAVSGGQPPLKAALAVGWLR